MQKNKVNNIIVLKNISSNIVEEAIVVLKSNVNFKNNELIKNKKEENAHFTIVKEAEHVIEDYISKMKTKNKELEEFKIKKKYKNLKRITIATVVLNFVLLLKIF